MFTPAGVSHNLKAVTGTSGPGIEGSLASSVKDKLVSWVKAAL